VRLFAAARRKPAQLIAINPKAQSPRWNHHVEPFE
jgi:hypothetical protein